MSAGRTPAIPGILVTGRSSGRCSSSGTRGSPHGDRLDQRSTVATRAHAGQVMKMATNPTAQVTAFSRDVLGRFICNGLDEALGSADTQRPRSDGSPQNDARPFDLIVVGGGTFGAVIAAHMFHTDKLHRHRILVLEGGPFVLTEHVQDLPMLGLDVPGATSIAD